MVALSARWLFRRHIVPLLKYDDQILRDIGHRREDILWANQLPLKVDALQALKARQKNVISCTANLRKASPLGRQRSFFLSPKTMQNHHNH
ncbi:hypothetical protein DK37_08825 [Halomonas sp. SUBG004]|nr:hypothetical protein DK37_08825 [Halomonas sp. SUBG004]